MEEKFIRSIAANHEYTVPHHQHDCPFSYSKWQGRHPGHVVYHPYRLHGGGYCVTPSIGKDYPDGKLAMELFGAKVCVSHLFSSIFSW